MKDNEQYTHPLLSVENLVIGFSRGARQEAEGMAVNGISFSLHPKETLCLVGESGCGKSVSALSLLGLLPTPPAQIMGGKAMFEGQDLLSASEAEMQRIRGNKIGIVFQDPMASLNPVMRIGIQITEGLRRHNALARRQAHNEAVELLQKVGIPDPETRVNDYPHQMSGGMRQRVMIAIAMACKPALLIADEPTTALDVTIQRQIMELISSVANDSALLLISHDLGVVAEYADKVAVMYAGHIVEEGTAKDILHSPAHPYSSALLRSRQDLERGYDGSGKRHITAIPGIVPGLWNRPKGCPFHPRCSFAAEVCQHAFPQKKILQGREHKVCCHFPLQY